MEYKIVSHYREKEELRLAFEALSEKTFGLSFEGWYHNGFWREQYIPYSILADGKIVSNVSVNLIPCTVSGKQRRYIQLGTIMTDEDYRHQGLARVLMERVLEDFADCDGFFLFANDSVLDFYPKFGFRRAEEYRFRTTVSTDAPACVTPVPMQTAEDFQNFLHIRSTHPSRSPVRTDTADLLMFYLTQFMQECVFKVEDRDCYVIAETEGDTLTIYDILSPEPADPVEIAECFGSEIKNVSFAFLPEGYESLERYLYQEEDTTFFVLGEPLCSDLPEILSFPALIHA